MVVKMRRLGMPLMLFVWLAGFSDIARAASPCTGSWNNGGAVAVTFSIHQRVLLPDYIEILVDALKPSIIGSETHWGHPYMNYNQWTYGLNNDCPGPGCQNKDADIHGTGATTTQCETRCTSYDNCLSWDPALGEIRGRLWVPYQSGDLYCCMGMMTKYCSSENACTMWEYYGPEGVGYCYYYLL